MKMEKTLHGKAIKIPRIEVSSCYREDIAQAGKMQTVLHLKILKAMKQNETNVIANRMRIRR